MPTASPYPPICIPPVDVWTFLFERAERPYPDNHVIFVDIATAKKHTFQEVRRTSIEVGRGLQTHWKWQKGDVMAVFSPNSADLGAIVAGTLWAGGVVCPINNLYTVGELASLLKSSGAKALTTHTSCLEIAREAALIVGLPLNRVVLVGDPDNKGKTKYFSSLRDASNAGVNAPINPSEDLAFLVYSSGTTGLPKGVMLSHENIVANIVQQNSVEPESTNWKTDSMIAFLPMFHIYGIAAMLFLPIYKGLTVHIMQRFDLKQMLEGIHTNKVTIAFVVPPVVLLLAKSPLVEMYNLCSLRMIHSAAAPLTTDLIDLVHKRLRVPVKQSYGMTESSPAICAQTLLDWNKPSGSVGKLIPSMRMKAMNGNTESPAGEEGEIWMQGPNVFRGYHQNPKATAESITDGRFRSGDIGYIDKAGNLFLTDRLKEIIKYNGFQVAPAQLEGLLLSHPAVNDVAVIDVDNRDRTTELPRAYIVPAPGYTTGEKLEREITTWLHAKVAPYKRLRGGIKFIDEVPKSVAGKILRRVLVEQVKKEDDEMKISSRL